MYYEQREKDTWQNGWKDEQIFWEIAVKDLWKDYIFFTISKALFYNL